jgi:predicted metal-dependent phosphoesterase TrpH
MALVDLHLHTTASDGCLTPSQLIHFVAHRGLKIVAITDHDTTNGLAEAFSAAQDYPDLMIIPGVELSADIPGDEVHILGYYLDHLNEVFQNTLHQFRQGRETRARQMVNKLAEFDVHIQWNRVVELAGDGAIGRPHIARAMVEKNYVSDLREAFDLYLGRNGPAYVERNKLTPIEAVRLIQGVGGVPVLAHPTYIQDMDAVLEELVPEGLVGMEVHYAEYNTETREALAQTAHRHGLLPCGGSDYHANAVPGEPEPGDLGPPLEVVEKLAMFARTVTQVPNVTEYKATSPPRDE